MVEESLVDILRRLLINEESGILYVVHNAFEQVTLNVVRKEVIGDLLDAHIEISFNAHVPVHKLLEKLLTSSSFMAPIAMFIRPIRDTFMKKK